MKKPFSEYTRKELDSLMDRKWKKMCGKHPHFNLTFLCQMHDLLDWYTEKLKLITFKK